MIIDGNLPYSDGGGGGCLPLLCSIFIIIIGSVLVLFGGG